MVDKMSENASTETSLEKEEKPKSSSEKEESKTAKAEVKSHPKRWPSNQLDLVIYNDLISPLKSIIYSGYKLIRNKKSSFEYNGYNIGDFDLQSNPSMSERFSEKFLEEEKKSNRTLLDNVLNAAFLLGMEQGRRVERKRQDNVSAMAKALEDYRNKNIELRKKIDELEIAASILREDPNIDKELLSEKVNQELDRRRPKRLQEIKKDLSIDPIKSHFSLSEIRKTKFKDLVYLAATIDKKTSASEWIKLLKEHGWTLEEFKKTCKKKLSKN